MTPKENNLNVDLFDNPIPEKPKKPKCFNCKFGGQQFKIANKTHLHCEHPKYKKEDFESGKLSAWDTLQEFGWTCEDHEFKEVKQEITNL